MESARLMRAGLLALSILLAACGEDERNGKMPTGSDSPGGVDIRIPGMDGEARVQFDEDGILHARCETDADCMRVLGYFHAHARFFQMDLQRRLARGRLGTLAATEIVRDPGWRQMFSTPQGEPLEEAIWRILGEDERALVEAYAQGVNAWLDDLREGRNGAELSEDYAAIGLTSPELIPEWEALDTVAFARLMTYLLSSTWEEEIFFGAAFSQLASVSLEAAVDHFTPRPAAKAYTLPAAQAGARAVAGVPKLDGLQALAERLGAVRGLMDRVRAEGPFLPFFGGLDASFGSNNWALAPSRTRDGKALLANDPHLMLSNPPVFYLAHLDAVTEGRGTLHVAGATFPGIPAVVIGRNERVAWGATVAYYDVTDVYVEQLTEDGNAVIFDGEEVEIVRKTVRFETRSGEPVEFVLEWVPHHGPIVQKDVNNRRALSVRWTGHEPSNEIAAFVGLNRAGSVAEAKKALEHFEVGAQNFVLADVDGSIGWFPHARVPKRPWASYSEADPAGSLPPWMPLQGDGSAEWEGYLDASELPSAFDPPAGFVATANQDLTGATEDGDPTAGGPYLQGMTAPGVRMARILERIEAGENEHTVETMLALQLDTHSLLGEWIVPKLLAAAEEAELSAEAETLLGVLAEWDYTCPTGLATSDPKGAAHEDPAVRKEARGCAAFHFTFNRLLRVALENRQQAAGIGPAGWDANHLVRPLAIALLRPEDLVQSPEEFWTPLGAEAPRTEREALLEAIEKAAAEIVGPWGRDPEGWLWGKVHTVTFASQLPIPSLHHGPFAGAGGLLTVNVANPSISPSGSFAFGQGASLRIVNELGEDGITTWVQLPGGRDLHRTSAFFGNLVERWLAGEPIRMPFTPEEVDAAGTGVLRVGD